MPVILKISGMYRVEHVQGVYTYVILTTLFPHFCCTLIHPFVGTLAVFAIFMIVNVFSENPVFP